MFCHFESFLLIRLSGRKSAINQITRNNNTFTPKLNWKLSLKAQGMGNKATFAKAREQFVKLLPKAADSESDILYDKDQISAILFRQQERLRLEQESKRVLDEAGKYIWTNEREYKRLMKQYHDLQSKLW